MSEPSSKKRRLSDAADAAAPAVADELGGEGGAAEPAGALPDGVVRADAPDAATQSTGAEVKPAPAEPPRLDSLSATRARREHSHMAAEKRREEERRQEEEDRRAALKEREQKQGWLSQQARLPAAGRAQRHPAPR
jgi:hypothetical protein